jgi:FtsJ-like methyltransferase
VEYMIKVVYDIKIYRKGLKEIIKTDDVVVELGCHVGNSTRIIAQNNPHGKIFSLDKSHESVDKMGHLMEEYPQLEFIQADVRLHETLESTSEKLVGLGGCDLLSVDLGGGYHPDTTFKVFFIWSSTLKPQNTIIRNKGLLDFLNSTSSSEVITSRNGWLESCGDDGLPPRLKEFKLWSPKL